MALNCYIISVEIKFEKRIPKSKYENRKTLFRLIVHFNKNNEKPQKSTKNTN